MKHYLVIDEKERHKKYTHLYKDEVIEAKELFKRFRDKVKFLMEFGNTLTFEDDSLRNLYHSNRYDLFAYLYFNKPLTEEQQKIIQSVLSYIKKPHTCA